MKNMMKKLVSILMAVAIIASIAVPSVFAVSGNTKAYLIQNKNEPVYEDTALKRKIGTVYGSDELIIED